MEKLIDDDIINISVQEGSSGSRKKIPQTPAKRKLRKENNYKGAFFVSFKRPCNHNGKSYMCNKVKMSDIQLIRENFYNIPDKITQDVKLCHMLSVCSVMRKRSVREDSKNRSLNITYYLKTKKNMSTKVCQTVFIQVLGVGRNRIYTVANVIHEWKAPKENRGGHRLSTKSEHKKNKVRRFIGDLKGTESHYNRLKSKRIYLPATLTISKLHKMYNLKSEEKYKCSLSMFSRIFGREFNVGFSSPAADCCSLCTRLNHSIRTEKDNKTKADLIVKRRIHKVRANAFYQLTKEAPPNSITFCFDMQQVQPLPPTPISDAFYSHQISFYILCCVGMSSNDPTFYTWTEDLAGRGSVEVSSALFCDGCGGQNKNSHLIHALYYWLKVKSPPGLQEIQLTFPVRGHSFLPADRAFGRVEKTLRKHTTLIKKEEYVKLYSQFGNVKQLGIDWKLYDVKGLQDNLKKVDGISEYKRIFIQKRTENKGRNNTVVVQCYQNFKFISPTEKPQKLVKRGKRDPVDLKEIELGRILPEKKKKTIRHLMEQQFGSKWEEDENLDWYRSILSENGMEEPEEDLNEMCDCLEDDVGLHI